MPECVLQKTCVAYKNWHCGNFLQENCQPINNCGPAQETVPDCSYLFLFFEILYSRQHFLLEPDLKKFVWDIYIDRFFIPPNKMRAHFLLGCIFVPRLIQAISCNSWNLLSRPHVCLVDFIFITLRNWRFFLFYRGFKESMLQKSDFACIANICFVASGNISFARAAMDFILWTALN